ncbi:MAG: outer membrane protein transport protein [Bacteroidota bacterium]|nr:outer membrane protein transport protein [Bacteroidota bacterium]
MKKFINISFLFAFVVLFVTTQYLFAGGFQINEHGAKAMGMGGAFTGLASDPSAIFFNPAGLSFQKGANIMLGTTLIFPSTTFTPKGSTQDAKMKSQIFYPSNIYGTYTMDDGLAFGIGVYNPYGLGTVWDKDWVGSRIATKTELQTFFINPSVSYKFNEQLSFGIGVSYVLANVELSFRVPTFRTLLPPTPSTTDGTASLEADGNGINFNAGIIYRPFDNLMLGLAYRHSTKLELEGTAKFTDMNALQSFFPGGDGSTEITLPLNLTFGAAIDVTKELTVSTDIQFIGWSSYDSLVVKITEGPASPLGVLQKGSTSIKDWKNAFILRWGVEYRFENWSLRGGLVFDVTPQPLHKTEPMLPDGNRGEAMLGIGYNITENIMIDAAYQFIKLEQRAVVYSDINFLGTYKSDAHLFGINVGYKF